MNQANINNVLSLKEYFFSFFHFAYNIHLPSECIVISLLHGMQQALWCIWGTGLNVKYIYAWWAILYDLGTLLY